MLATVASSNSAERLKNYVYKEHSVFSKIIQTPASLTKEGCGYCVRFDDKYKIFFERAGKKLGINIRGFYKEVPEKGKTRFIKE